MLQIQALISLVANVRLIDSDLELLRFKNKSLREKINEINQTRKCQRLYMIRNKYYIYNQTSLLVTLLNIILNRSILLKL